MGKETIELKPMPHAICVPFPAQGHVNPMMKLAKILHGRGFHITFVNTEYNHRRLLNSRGSDSMLGHPNFMFETIPDGLPPSDANTTQDVPSLCDSTRKNCLVPFRELVDRLNGDAENPVTCIVSDGIMSFTLEVAKELGIPNVLFWTPSACGVMGYMQYRRLIEEGLTPLKDESYLTNGYLETPIDWIPGMRNIRLKDMPSFIRTTDPNDLMVEYAMTQVEKASSGSALILNTFDALEHDVLEAISAVVPRLYTIGPLSLLLPPNNNGSLASIGSNLWKDQPECLEWLDTMDPLSVMYINYGSVTVMSPQQLIEFAWGLANSKRPFLWIIRPDLVTGELAMLPSEFLLETEGRSLLASWCPQEQVLNHPAVGGFLTHCGWNSTIESICAGVPMICWPFFSEQQTNCHFCCSEWGVGMEVEADAKRDVIEAMVNELMHGKKGKEMRNKAISWKMKAREATSSPSGSSYTNLEKLIDHVLLVNYK